MVGAAGRVTAIQLDAELAERLKENFAGQRNVLAVQGNGAQGDFDPADVIYVNAGATYPPGIWLDRLNDGGRLILPLTMDKERRGATFRIERRGGDFLAKWILPMEIFPCEGARDAESERALVAAFGKGGGERVTRLHPRDEVPDEECWVRGQDWCLAYR